MKSVALKLRNEIKRIRDDLAMRTMRVEKLEEVLVHYEDLSQARAVTNGVRPSKAHQIRSEIVGLLVHGPLHRREILDELAKKKILDGTEEDMNYLASRLSMWPETATDGKGHWHLNRS
jgi:hypothetical protein